MTSHIELTGETTVEQLLSVLNKYGLSVESLKCKKVNETRTFVVVLNGPYGESTGGQGSNWTESMNNALNSWLRVNPVDSLG